jgi:hypothetical protein
MSTSSEEFRKFVNHLLYEESKINIQNINNLQIFERAQTLKHRIMNQRKTILQHIQRPQIHTRRFYIITIQLIEFFINTSTTQTTKQC